MDAIEFDTEREVQAVEVTTSHGRPAFRVDVPVRPSDTLQVIFQHGLVGQPYYLWDCVVHPFGPRGRTGFSHR